MRLSRLVAFLGQYDMVNKELTSLMQEAAARNYPEEACGLVILKGKKTIAIECKNIAEKPNEHFMIDAQEYGDAADQGEIIGVWHTHPETSPKPSPADLAACENSELPWFILAVHKAEGEFTFSEVTVTEPTGFEMGYLERPYVFGVFDCYTLVRDYYKREFSIHLNEYPRVESFWAKGKNFFADNFAKEGFVRVEGSDYQVGDLLIMQSGAVLPNHIAIYIGDDKILHHCHGRLSRRDVYGGYWYKNTTHHIRRNLNAN